MIGEILRMEQGTPEWLQARLGLATTSNFGKIMAKGRNGEEAYTRRDYRMQLVLELLTGKTPVRFEKTEDMKWGNETEALARVEVGLRQKRAWHQVGLIKHAFLPVAYSPDGIDNPDVPITENLEIKCFKSANHAEMLRTRKLPSEYKPQAQGGMWISEAKGCWFASFDPDFPPNAQLVVLWVERDQRYIDDLAVEVVDFLAEVSAEVEAIKNYKEDK